MTNKNSNFPQVVGVVLGGVDTEKENLRVIINDHNPPHILYQG